jgi:ABC-2 type transport system permease protein
MSTLTGTGALLRFALRRDRVPIPAWALGVTLLVVSTAASFDQLYRTTAERARFANEVSGNPVFKALYGGSIHALSTGGLTAWRTAGSATLLAGLMSLLLMTRHGRAEEEAGRAELLGATVVGRHAGTVAALLAVGVANLAIALLVTLGLVGVGLPAGGSAALGFAIGSAGCFFGAVSAVSGQIASTGRAASGAAGAVLGLAFLLRGIGDAGNGVLSWLSPLGWAELVRSFGDQRVWVIGLALAATVALVPVALVLVSRRDQGMGLLPSRPGPAAAAASLGSPLGLAWRLQRGPLLGWVAGFGAAGIVVGAIAKDVADVFGDNQQLAEVLRRLGGAGAIADQFLGSIMGLFALVAAGYAIQAVLRIRSEETAGRGELVLGTSVSRWRWAGAHLACAAAGTLAIMLAAGLAMGLLHGLRTGDLGGEVPKLVEAALVQVPAAWVLGGVAFALAGVLPRLVSLGWVAFAFCFALLELGEAFKLPGWALDLSPFRHAPRLPAVDLRALPLLALVVAAGVLALVGLVGVGRRDIA